MPSDSCVIAAHKRNLRAVYAEQEPRRVLRVIVEIREDRKQSFFHLRVFRRVRDGTGASVNKIKLNVNAIFTAAVKKEIMRRNPCQLVTPPKIDTPPAAFLDEEQSNVLLDAVRENGDFQLEVIVNLFLAAGLRSGELLALHWDDADLQTGVLHIRNTLVLHAGEYRRLPPKTVLSARRIILPVYIIDLLKEHKKRQAEYAVRLGGVWRDRQGMIMFTNTTGGYISAPALNKRIRKLCVAAGLPNIHVHSLRHTHASLLINSDIAAKVVADRLGHVKTSTTLNTYSHVFAASEVKAMQAMEMKLFQNRTL